MRFDSSDSLHSTFDINVLFAPFTSIAELGIVSRVHTAPPSYGCFPHLHHRCPRLGWHAYEITTTRPALFHRGWLCVHNLSCGWWRWFSVQHQGPWIPSRQYKDHAGPTSSELLIVSVATFILNQSHCFVTAATSCVSSVAVNECSCKVRIE